MNDNEKELSKAISDVREWLIRIDTNQKHQTNLLETLNKQAENAFSKADRAEDVAEEALRLSENNKKRLDEQEKEQKVEKRWQIGTVLAVIGLYLSYLGGL